VVKGGVDAWGGEVGLKSGEASRQGSKTLHGELAGKEQGSLVS